MYLCTLPSSQPNGAAQFYFGFMYNDGEGVPEDHVLSYMWYNLAAAAQGFDFVRERAQSNKYILERQMTREQIAEAQRMSREWIAAHPGVGN